jgi:hypothetical protein
MGARAGVVLAALVAAVVCGTGAQAQYLCVSAGRPARVFYPGEAIQLSVEAAGPLTRGTVCVSDYYGRQRRLQAVQVGENVPQALSFPAGWPVGIYYLRFALRNGQAQEDAFCIIPRPDEQPGEYGPFSWRLGSDDPNQWAALAQAGCRLVRRDVDWVSTMPTADTVDLSKAQAIAGLCEQYGMQLIPILGYSPKWTAMQPANGSDRSATDYPTWAPDSTVGWRQYVSAVAGYLAAQRVQWPAAATLQPESALETDSQPLVQSWEIWNEADQNYYYGYWQRYVDLLRIANGEIKRQDPAATVLYGGSCGHWTELGETYTMQGQYFFDRLAFHPGGTDLDQTFKTYFCGAPQIGNGYGLYHPATMTEAYPDCPAGVSPSQYMLRLYATLLQWGLDTYCTFDGGEVVGASDPDSGALLWQQGPAVVPNAKYVALAVARWVLSDCVYVGPLQWGEGVQAQLFLHQGWPLVVAWADTPQTVTVTAGPHPSTSDEMGRQQPLSAGGGQVQVSLSPAPQVLRGLDRSYVAQAVTNQAEIVLQTPQGFSTTSNFGYIGPLQDDAAWAWAGWPTAVRGALAQATAAIVANPVRGGPLLGLAQTEISSQITRYLRKCPSAGGLSGRGQATIWRIETMSEWLGAVLDSYDQLWGRFHATTATLDALDAKQQALSPLVDNIDQGLICPLGLQSLRRSEASLARARAGLGLGARAAAQAEYNAALLYQQQLPTMLTGVVAAPDFVTATQLVKSLALCPGQDHQVRCYVHNCTPHGVAGTLTLQDADGWTVQPAAAPFTAPADGISPAVRFTVTVPGPQPWVSTAEWTSVGTIYLNCPQGQCGWTTLTLGGTLSDGRQLLDTPYGVLVGQLPGTAGAAAVKVAAAGR